MFRFLGVIGSASCMALLIYFLMEEGLPKEPIEWWIAISLALVGFNLFPVSKSNDSLMGLWVEAKKSKLRKEL